MALENNAKDMFASLQNKFKKSQLFAKKRNTKICWHCSPINLQR